MFFTYAECTVCHCLGCILPSCVFLCLLTFIDFFYLEHIPDTNLRYIFPTLNMKTHSHLFPLKFRTCLLLANLGKVTLCLLCRLSLKHGTLVRACNPRIWEVEVGRSGVQGQPQLYENLAQKKKNLNI